MNRKKVPEDIVLYGTLRVVRDDENRSYLIRVWSIPRFREWVANGKPSDGEFDKARGGIMPERKRV